MTTAKLSAYDPWCPVCSYPTVQPKIIPIPSFWDREASVQGELRCTNCGWRPGERDVEQGRAS